MPWLFRGMSRLLVDGKGESKVPNGIVNRWGTKKKSLALARLFCFSGCLDGVLFAGTCGGRLFL